MRSPGGEAPRLPAPIKTQQRDQMVGPPRELGSRRRGVNEARPQLLRRVSRPDGGAHMRWMLGRADGLAEVSSSKPESPAQIDCLQNRESDLIG